MHDFLINALLAGVGLAVLAGSLGCIVVWRRMAYFGDTLAHAALLGIAVAILFDSIPLLGVILVSVLIALLLYRLEKHKDLSTDTLLGILSHSSLALGLIVISMLQYNNPGVDLMSYLVGDILATSDEELKWIYAGVILVSIIFVWQWRALLSICVHEELAQLDGVSVFKTRFIFMLLLAIVIALAIKVVGILLITALLIIPAAIARIFSVSPVQMIILSIVFSLISVVGGLGASLLWDTPAGPSIVLMASAMFLLSRAVRLR